MIKFLIRSYLTLSAVGIAAYLCSFATLFLMPQILAHRFELSASASGLVIFPGSLLAMLISRRVGRIIDHYGNGSIIRYVPWLVLASVVLFALFVGMSYIAILLIYMLMSEHRLYLPYEQYFQRNVAHSAQVADRIRFGVVSVTSVLQRVMPLRPVP